MSGLELQDRMLLLSAWGIILAIDLVIVIMGWLYRKKFDFIPPKFFGVMSGKHTEEIVKKFGIGFTSNCLFMLPVFLISMFWLLLLANLAPNLIQIMIGVLVGFHITLLLFSLMKISIISVLEQKYKKTFVPRVTKAINVFLRG